jgi:hypothetical protein
MSKTTNTKSASALRSAGLAALLMALAAMPGCTKQSTTAAAGTSAFPQSNEVAGWTKSGDTRTFAPAELSNYIDGDAEKYIKAGVRSTATADYKFADQTQAVADVYTMSSADGAKAIFEAEPAGDAKPAAVGDAARLYAQSLVFRTGPYFVQIVAYQTSPKLPSALTDLGKGIERKLAEGQKR